MVKMKLSALTDHDLIELSQRCESISQIVGLLGYSLTGRAHKTVKLRLVRLGLYEELIARTNQLRVRQLRTVNRIPDEQYFQGNTNRHGTDLKKRMLAAGYPHKCSVCGLEPMWNGKALSLQVDHISGDRTDNHIENLRLVCPNCHSQTPTFGTKNRSRSSNGKDLTLST